MRFHRSHSVSLLALPVSAFLIFLALFFHAVHGRKPRYSELQILISKKGKRTFAVVPTRLPQLCMCVLICDLGWVWDTPWYTAPQDYMKWARVLKEIKWTRLGNHSKGKPNGVYLQGWRALSYLLLCPHDFWP